MKKMKQIAVILLAMVLLVACVYVATPKAYAATVTASGTCGTNVTWSLDDAGILTISGNGPMYNYSYGSAPWYSYIDQIMDLVIEDGVTSVGDCAFYECYSLTSVTMSESVTNIGNCAFYGCYNLTTAPIGNGVTIIGDAAFLDCGGLTSVTIPNSVTSIGCEAFRGCACLYTVIIGNSVASIGDSAFYQCHSLKRIWVWGSAAYSSDENGVLFNKEMTELIQVPCGINGAYTIPDSVINIGDEAFSHCSLTSITIPNSVTSVGDSAFASSSLTSVTIPNSVTSIGNCAFLDCNNLTSVTIPNSVTSIGDSAFGWCSSLNSVMFQGDTPTIERDVFSSVSATAYYPAGNSTWTTDVMQNYGGTITWVAYETEGVDVVKEWNISLSDDFAVKFYIDAGVAVTDTVSVTVGDDTVEYTVGNLKTDEQGRYIVTVHIAAAQMNDRIELCVTDMEPCEYTVRQYCDTILADESHSEYHALVKEMLNYGAMAQVYFDYDADNLANTGITDVAAEEIPETADELTVSDKISDLNFHGASLVYRERIAVRLYFTGDVTDCTFADAQGNRYTPVTKDGMQYVEIADILPQNLDQQITLTVTDAEGNQLSVAYGPMNYIVRMTEKSSENLVNLLKALYNYHLAAKELPTAA